MGILNSSAAVYREASATKYLSPPTLVLPPYISVFAKPGISALIMGVFTWLSYKGMYTLTSSNVLALVIAFMVALITYFGPYYALTKMRVFE